LKFSFEPDDLDILQGIVEESSEHLHGIEEGIVRLEVDFNSDLIDSIFRALHSVKGVASFVDFTPVKDTAHALESLLMDMKKGIYTVNSDITDILLRGVDILNLLLAQLQVWVQNLEANPPRDVFEIEVNDYGFREFVAGVEELRSQQLAVGDEGGQPEDLAARPEPAEVILPQISSFADQMREDFIDETFEHLDEIEQKCVKLEQDRSNPELINSILRGFHSIKGGAGVISSMRDEDKPDDPIIPIKTLTHAAESLLQKFRNEARPVPTEVIDVVLLAVDKVALLNKALRDHQIDADLNIDHLLEKIRRLSINEGARTGESDGEGDSRQFKMPQQLEAFINITSQALHSMDKLIQSLNEGADLDRRKISQYNRALKSIAASASYLNYEEIISLAEKSQSHLENYAPGDEASGSNWLQVLSEDYLVLKELVEARVTSVRRQLEEVPASYAGKKLGEILIEEKKATPEQIEWALKQQKKLGTILVDSGTVKPEDIEIALAKQSVSRELTMDRADEVKATIEVTGQSIRVSQDKLDRLMNMIGELLISKNRVFHLADKVSMDFNLPVLAREIKNVAGELSRISDELQNAIMSTRMIPLKVLFQRYPRTIRDIARKSGKTVQLTIQGDDIELDKTIIEAINDPLVHMLRNAVDHAIELPEVRKAMGKETTGHVGLKAFYQGTYVVIEITDDGKGLNPEEIKLKAIKKGLISHEQIEKMSNEDAYQLIFAPGFSTKDQVTELSGRGVGMDVVKNNIEGVGGSISLTSVPNQGTTFSLKIPLSMSVIKGLMVETSGQCFIIPLDAIEETVKIPGNAVRFYKQHMVADIRGGILPLVNLRDILRIDHDGNKKVREQTTQAMIPVVVLNITGSKLGVIIDSFQKEQEFVVKALVNELAALRIYTGATIMGDGSVVLILNPAQLLYGYAAGDFQEGTGWQ
jgi:two-component system chemotaxis sensor kinase CheA